MRTTQIIASAAIRNANPIRVVAAPTDILRSKYPPPIFSNSKPQPVKPSNSAMEVHCVVGRLARGDYTQDPGYRAGKTKDVPPPEEAQQ